MKTRALIVVPVALIAAAASAASADSVVWTGEVAEGNSWTAEFVALSAGAADFLGVRVTSQTGTLEGPAFLEFSNASWSNAGYHGDLPVLAGAAGEAFNELEFTLHFAGDLTDTISYDLVLFNGEEVASVFNLAWDGTAFTIGHGGSTYDVQRSVFEGNSVSIPLPTAAGLGGMALLGAAGVRRGRRA